MIKSFVETYFTYRLLKIISQSWEKTDAYKAGVIDAQGNRIPGDLTDSQKKTYGVFDRVAYNIKRTVAKVPGSQNPFVRIATAVALIRENTLLESDVDSLVDELTEEGEGGGQPVNNTGNGQVAYRDVPLLRKKPLTRKSLGETLNFRK